VGWDCDSATVMVKYCFKILVILFFFDTMPLLCTYIYIYYVHIHSKENVCIKARITSILKRREYLSLCMVFVC
jgi:hypothetical protein